MILFGNRVFVDLISENEVILIRAGPNSNVTGVLIKRGRDTDTEGEDQVMTKAKTGVMKLQAK